MAQKIASYKYILSVLWPYRLPLSSDLMTPNAAQTQVDFATRHLLVSTAMPIQATLGVTVSGTTVQNHRLGIAAAATTWPQLSAKTFEIRPDCARP